MYSDRGVPPCITKPSETIILNRKHSTKSTEQFKILEEDNNTNQRNSLKQTTLKKTIFGHHTREMLIMELLCKMPARMPFSIKPSMHQTQSIFQ